MAYSQMTRPSVMRHCGLISGFIQQAPKEPYITQRLLICRGIRQKMMVWRSLQDPGDTGKSSSHRQADARLHIKAVFTRSHTQCSDRLHCRDAHGNKMDTPLKGNQRSLEIECKHSQKTFTRGSRSWHGLFQCISIFEISVRLAVWIHKVNVPVSVFI